MPESPRPTPNYGRRIVWLAVFVVVLVACYSAGWFYLAGQIETRAAAATSALRADGIEAECENAEARGYPFRIGLFCDHVRVTAEAQAASATTGAFRSAGQIYDPLRVVAELDGPATIAAPAIGSVSLTWRLLRGSVRLAEPLPTRVSVEGSAFQATTSAGAPLVSADTFEGHMRPSGNDVDLAFRVGGLSIDGSLLQGRVLPPLSGEGDVAVTNGVARIAARTESLRGLGGTIRTLSLSPGGNGSVTVSGPVAIADDGLIDAELEIALSEPKALEQALSTAFPEAADQIRQGFAGLALLGSTPKLPLRIVDGRATLGFIPLGVVPPVD